MKKSFMRTHVSAKGQIIIPAALRRKYSIKKGTRIIFSDIGDAIIMKPMTDQYLRNLQGSLKGKGGLKVSLNGRRKDTKSEQTAKVLFRCSRKGGGCQLNFMAHREYIIPQ